MKFFGVKEFFYMIFDFKNGCENEFKDNNEKSCNWFRNRVSRKIDFKVQWLRNSHADSVGVKMQNKIKCIIDVSFVAYFFEVWRLNGKLSKTDFLRSIGTSVFSLRTSSSVSVR